MRSAPSTGSSPGSDVVVDLDPLPAAGAIRRRIIQLRSAPRSLGFGQPVNADVQVMPMTAPSANRNTNGQVFRIEHPIHRAPPLIRAIHADIVCSDGSIGRMRMKMRDEKVREPCVAEFARIPNDPARTCLRSSPDLSSVTLLRNRVGVRSADVRHLQFDRLFNRLKAGKTDSELIWPGEERNVILPCCDDWGNRAVGTSQNYVAALINKPSELNTRTSMSRVGVRRLRLLRDRIVLVSPFRNENCASRSGLRAFCCVMK